MNAAQIKSLINAVSSSSVRQKLMKMSIKDRIPAIADLWPYIKADKQVKAFIAENFKKEAGALIVAKMDEDKAVELFKQNRAAEKEGRRKYMTKR